MKEINVNMRPFYNYFMGPLLGIGLTCSLIKCDVFGEKNYRSIDDIKKEIKQKDPQRYDSICRNKQRAMLSSTEWEYEERLMNEAIRTDSMVKRAYFEGAQMVRDSLNKGNK